MCVQSLVLEPQIPLLHLSSCFASFGAQFECLLQPANEDERSVLAGLCVPYHNDTSLLKSLSVGLHLSIFASSEPTPGPQNGYLVDPDRALSEGDNNGHMTIAEGKEADQFLRESLGSQAGAVIPCLSSRCLPGLAKCSVFISQVFAHWKWTKVLLLFKQLICSNYHIVSLQCQSY